MPRKKIASTIQVDDSAAKETVPCLKTWYSLDKATGGGLPYGIIEISGWPATGKSSIAQALAGMVNPKGRVVYMPLEDYTADYIAKGLASVGFGGKLYIVPNIKNKKPVSHEEMIDDMCEQLNDENTFAAVWDSIGATTALAALEGSVGDAVMGKRAMIVRRAIDKIHFALRSKQGMVIGTNHCHQDLGSKGVHTSGGQAVLYLTTARLRLSRLQEDLDNDVIFVQGRVDRLKYKVNNGNREEVFWAAVSPRTHGFHPGLTALLDCEKYLIATRENGVIRMNGKSYGRLSKIVADQLMDDDLFSNFQAALKKAR